MTCLNKYCFTFCSLLFFLAGSISTARSQQLPARDFIFYLEKGASTPADRLFMQSMTERKPVDNHFSVIDFEFHVLESGQDTASLVFHDRGAITTLADGRHLEGNIARINIGAYQKSPVEFINTLNIPPAVLNDKNYCLFQFLSTKRPELLKTKSPNSLFVVHVGSIGKSFQNQALRERLRNKNITIRSRYFCLFMHPDDLEVFANTFQIDWIASYQPDTKKLNWLNLKEVSESELTDWLNTIEEFDGLLYDTATDDTAEEEHHDYSTANLNLLMSSDTISDAQQSNDTLAFVEAEVHIPEIADSIVITHDTLYEKGHFHKIDPIEETVTADEADAIHEPDSLPESGDAIVKDMPFIEPSHPYFIITGAFDDGLEIRYRVFHRTSIEDKTGRIKNGIFIPDIESEYRIALLQGGTLRLDITKPEGYNIKRQADTPPAEELHALVLTFTFSRDNASEKVLPIEIWPWNYFNILYLSLHEVRQRIEIRDTLEKLLDHFAENREGFLIYLSNGRQPISADNPNDYDRTIYMALHNLRPGLPSRNIDVPYLQRYVVENEVLNKHKGIRVWYFSSERMDNLFMGDIFDERFMRDFSTNNRQVLPVIHPFITKD